MKIASSKPQVKTAGPMMMGQLNCPTCGPVDMSALPQTSNTLGWFCPKCHKPLANTTGANSATVIQPKVSPPAQPTMPSVATSKTEIKKA